MPRLLLLNWRDPWHPKAGGAELMTLRLLERVAPRGWQIEWFSAHYAGAAFDETRNGIRYVRSGNQLTVHWSAFRQYRQSQPFDIIVDEINTIPFFTPLYAKVPSVALMYQLAREVWFYEAPLPMAVAGYLAEPLYMRAYRKTPVLSISQSSLQTFRRIGLTGPQHIVPISCDEPAVCVVPEKALPRDVITVCRVTSSKRVHHSVRAAAAMAKRGWQGSLHIVGGSNDQRYLAKLRQLSDDLLPGRVIHHGRVSDARRSELLKTASAIWMTSRREGWGLVITEAARNGTPAVVYDVPGLRDAVKTGITGYVVPEDPQALAQATLRLFDDPNYARFCENALADSLNYSWDRSADEFESLLCSYIEQGR